MFVKQHSQIKQQRGVGLIEIMVAVLLLSVGFLAAARMQVQSMRFSQSAYLESQAYFMISDMTDRMRGNIDGVTSDAYSNKSTSAALTDPGCATAYCTSSEQAQQDLFEWSANLHDLRDTDNFISLLPGRAASGSGPAVPATGEIIAKNNGTFAVKMTWYEKIGNDNEAQELELDFVPWL